MYQGKIAIFVNAFRFGKSIVKNARKMGFDCVQVRSSKNISSFLVGDYNNEDFCKEYLLDDNFDDLISELKSLNPVMVVAASESAVELADKIREALQLKGNCSNTSILRRNKFLMHDALKQNGIPIAKQIKSSNIEEIYTWITSNPDLGWPIVIKPVDSAGTDGLSFCFSLEEVKTAFENNIGKTNIIGTSINESMLVQEYLDGVEYVVNTLSDGKKHIVTDMWMYKKRKVNGAGAINDWQELINFNDPKLSELIEYAFKSLDAIGVKYGPGHCEIMLTNDGPRLLEIASRIPGGIDPNVLTECVEINQLDHTIKLYADLYDEKIDPLPQQSYLLKKNAAWINLIAEEDSVLQDADSFISEIKNLPSFFSFFSALKNGTHLRKTVDLISCPGALFLVHDDMQVIKEDYNRIRELEKLYFKQL